MADKKPVKATYSGTDTNGLAEFVAADTIGVVDGGTGLATVATSNILTGNGTSALSAEANLTFDGSTLAVTGAVTMANAAGPTIVNEAATATNPTLIPNKAEVDTGIGWAAADTLTAITGGTERMRIDGGGAVTMPTQSSFMAKNSVADSNVTGDGTVYTADFDTEIFDQHGDFSADVFTAPVTGRYLFSMNIICTGLTSSHTAANMQFVTSNRAYNHSFGAWNYADPGGGLYFSKTIFVDMDAADTCYVTVNVQNSTKVVDFQGDSYFSGALIN